MRLHPHGMVHLEQPPTYMMKKKTFLSFQCQQAQPISKTKMLKPE